MEAGLAASVAGVTNTYQPNDNTTTHYYSGKSKQCNCKIKKVKSKTKG
jgi:hypothetical protein